MPVGVTKASAVWHEEVSKIRLMVSSTRDVSAPFSNITSPVRSAKFKSNL